MVLLVGLEKVPWSPFLNELLGLFNCPPGSARDLLAGTLPLRFCTARFACRTPTWRLTVSGHVTRLVTASSEVVQGMVADGDEGGCFPRGSLGLVVLVLDLDGKEFD